MLKSLLVNKLIDQFFDSTSEERDHDEHEELIKHLRQQDRIQVEKDIELERIRALHNLRNKLLSITVTGLIGIGLLVMLEYMSLRPAATATVSLILASTIAIYYTGIQAASHRHVLESIIDDQDY